MKQFTLSKQERLKSRKRIDLLFQQGKRVHVNPLKAVYLLQPAAEEQGLQMGVSVSKRFFKRAVKRNRMKRLIKEAWRLEKKPLDALVKNQQLVVFVIYNSPELMAFTAVREKVKILIEKLCNIVGEKPTLHT